MTRQIQFIALSLLSLIHGYQALSSAFFFVLIALGTYFWVQDVDDPPNSEESQIMASVIAVTLWMTITHGCALATAVGSIMDRQAARRLIMFATPIAVVATIVYGDYLFAVLATVCFIAYLGTIVFERLGNSRSHDVN